ncbi:AB hydrolase-1 domain-containing protein [Citrus sinensis]|uniref:AB hydrolase-1 domain-containing protein n=1 Tax=Citrus sinensis TaxID=2711 RepID=A0ACB8N317_CITSI|nr:AB hydrolase-1 domain-containing protein [Citrus sinensis]
MTTLGASIFSTDISTAFHPEMTSLFWNQRRNPILKRLAVSTEQLASTATTVTSKTTPKRNFVEKESSEAAAFSTATAVKSKTTSTGTTYLSEESEGNRKSLKDYFDEAKDMIKADGAPPRWFSPLECGSHSPDSPLLLFLPGLVQLIERTIRSEHNHSPNKPIYLVGESLGACFALAVAARNPHIDLVLVLSNPATSFSMSVPQSTISLLEFIPGQMTLTLCHILSSMTGDPLKMAIDNVVKGISVPPTIQDLSTYLSVSGKDQMMPSEEEGQRLSRELPNCQTRSSAHVWQEEGVDLVTIIKGAGYYRRGKCINYVSDFIPLTTTEFNKFCEEIRCAQSDESLILEGTTWCISVEIHKYVVARLRSDLTSPVMLSTLEDGKIVADLSGIPSEGPVLYVGYHNLLGLEAFPMVQQFMIQRNVLVRCVAHPMFFESKDGGLPDFEGNDTLRIVGGVPASAVNLYKLLSSKSHVMLHPGGMREALHRKGEEYKLFWPESSEFVRMSSTFGAKIIPFGAVGEDDIAQIVLDYNDQMRIPFLKSQIEEMNKRVVKLRTDITGEVANQPVHLPLPIPKIPGRFYYYFGKPIETKGRKQELRDRKKSQKLYLQVKGEVENCIAYLKEKRQNDPYRNILPRLIYQATHGFRAQVPTFEL